MVEIIQSRFAGSVCFNVSHVADMPFRVVRPRVPAVGRIKMTACGTAIARAAVAEFVNMKAVIAGSETGDLRMHLHAIGFFSERDGALYIIPCGGMKHRNCFQWS